MKIGIFTKPNEKGQVVIPKEIRDALGIDEHVTLNMVLSGSGLHIYPVQEFIPKGESDNSYLKLLEKTKGKWSNNDQEKTEKDRTHLELSASKARKTAW